MYWVLDASGNRQTQVEPDVSDWIEMITPEETPILSRLSRQAAHNMEVTTMQDDLDEGDPENALGYGEDFKQGTTTTPGTLSNNIQRFQETATVKAGEQKIADAGGYYGVGDLLQREESKKMSTIFLSVEKRLISDASSQAAQSSNNFTGKAAGLASLIQTNVDGSTSSLSTSAIDDLMQTIRDQGGSPTDAYCDAAEKKAWDGLTTNVTRYSENTQQLINTVRTYLGSFGEINVHYHRFMPMDVNGSPAQVMLFQFPMIRLRPLGNPERESLPYTGSGYSTAIEWWTTWDMRTEKSCGMFTALSD